MIPGMRTICIYTSIAALILGLGWFGVRQYGNTRVAEAEVKVVKEAVQEAVAVRKEDLKADASAEEKNRAALVPVHAAVRKARIQNEKEPRSESTATAGSGVPVPDWSGVFNDAINAGNTAIESASGVSPAM